MDTKINILYIEDDNNQRQTFARKLRSKGFRVRTAASGEAGLQNFEKNGTDVILCDLNMPAMNGLQVLDRVKQMDSEIPFILLTSRGSITQAVTAIKHGAYDFILKPIEINNIQNTVHKAFEKTNLKKQLQQSEANLQMILKNVPDIVYSLNPEGEFISINKAGETALGYESSEILGASVFDFIHPEDKEVVRAGFEQSLKSGEESIGTVELRLISKGGEVKHFEAKRHLVFENGKVIKSDGIARDVTKRKQLEQELRNRSQELESRVKDRTESLEYAARQLAALNTVSNRFTQIYDEDELFEEVPELLTHSLDFDRATLLLEKDGELTLRSFCFEKDPPELVESFLDRTANNDFPIPPHFIESLEQNKTIFIPDLNADPRWPKQPGQIIHTKAVVVAPIKVKKESIGLIVGNMQYHDREMDAQDIARFEMFANMVGLAIDNIRAYQSLEKRVIERTKSLRDANRELREQTKELQKATHSLGKANIQLLSAQNQLESKHAEMEKLLKELSESKDELQAILDATPGGIIMVNHDDEVIAADKQIGEFFGLRIEEIINQNIGVFLEKTKGCFADFDQYCMDMDEMKTTDDKIFDREVRLVKPNPRTLSFNCVPVLDKNNDVLGKVWSYDDITKRKEAEDALRESEQRFRQLTENIHEAFWTFDLETNQVLYISQAYEEIFGRKRSDLYKHFESLLESIHPDDRERIKCCIDDAAGATFDEQVQGEWEYRIIRPDGSVRWIRERAFPIRNELGKVYRLCGVGEDFTERREAQEALKRERNFVSAVLDTAGALVVVLDPEGRIVRFNRACEQVSGYSFDEVKNKKFWDIFLTPEEFDMVRDRFEMLKTGPYPVKGDNYWVTKAGNQRLISWSNTALFHNEDAVEYIVAIGIDITERRQAEEALRDSEERFRNLVEYANDIIYSLTPEGVFSYVSPNWTDILGHEVSEVVGQPFVPFVHPDDLPACTEFFQKVITTGEKQGGIEYRVKHKDESWRWHTSNASGLKDDDGNVLYFIGVAHDITENKKIREDLERANQHLRQTQAQLVQSEKMAALGSLVAGIAHEINTPIGAVHSMHDTLMRAVEKLNDILEEQFPSAYKESTGFSATMQIIEDSNRVIETGCERVINIVRRLRSFARLDEAELKQADIQEGLEDTLTLLHHELKNRINVIRNFGDIPPISCYPGRLNQVFLNLLVNAKHAIKDTGEITITTFKQDNKVHVAIKDSGVGISKEHLDKLFDPGFTTKGAGIGTGLGLSICYQIIQDHQGEIKVESEIGKGSTFTVILPMDLDERIENRK